jgi:Fe(3+) dicitrate transport protein
VQNRFVLGKWAVTPGLRVEHIDYERTNRLGNGGAGVTGTTRLTQWVPGIGVAYNPTERVSVFTGVHRGFAPPRTEDILSNSTGAVVELDPELSWNYEVGARLTPVNGVRATATFFRMDYENQIVPASVAGGLGATLTNGGETLHQGFEMNTRIDTGPLRGSRHNFYSQIVYTYLPLAEFTGSRFSSVPGFQNVSVSGNRLPYAPEHVLNATVGYSHPMGLDALVEAATVSRQFGDDLNTVAATPDGQRSHRRLHGLESRRELPGRAVALDIFRRGQECFRPPLCSGSHPRDSAGQSAPVSGGCNLQVLVTAPGCTKYYSLGPVLC